MFHPNPPNQSPGATWRTRTPAAMLDPRATGRHTAGPARRVGAKPRRRKAQKVSLTSSGEKRRIEIAGLCDIEDNRGFQQNIFFSYVS